MKWYEIPKFKEFGLANPVNMGFVEYVEYIEREVTNYNLQLNPKFQRGHVWSEDQQIAYVEFLLRGGKSGRDFYFNWNKITDEYVCVDGLQRTTALYKFVNEEIKVFGQYFSEFEFGIVAGKTALAEFRLNVYQNHLTSKRELLEWYLDMNSGGTPHSAEEIERVKKMIEELE